jgi:hypothetical protein
MNAQICRLTGPLTLLLLGSLTAYALAADDDDGSSVSLRGNRGQTSYDARITTNQRGVWIEVEARQTTHRWTSGPTDDGGQPVGGPPVGTGVGGQPGGSGGQGGGTSGSDIRRSWYDPQRGYFSQTRDGRVYNLGAVDLGSDAVGPGGWFDRERRWHPDAVPMAFRVDGEFQGIVWVPAGSNPDDLHWGTPPDGQPGNAGSPGGAGRSVNVREIALTILDHLPLPEIQLQANPTLGLVSLPAWFWLEGYDGQPFGGARTVSLPPEVGPDVPVSDVPASDPRRQPSSLSIAVQVQPTRYEWSFGDGATLTTRSLGQRYPQDSDIQHTYEYSSLGLSDGFPLRLTVEFAAEFRVNGRSPESLPSMRRTYTAGYRVQEIQAVLTTR